MELKAVGCELSARGRDQARSAGGAGDVACRTLSAPSGAVADPASRAARIAAGERVKIGDATFEITATIASEPDKLRARNGFGPAADRRERSAARDQPLAAGQSRALDYRVKSREASARPRRIRERDAAALS